MRASLGSLGVGLVLDWGGIRLKRSNQRQETDLESFELSICFNFPFNQARRKAGRIEIPPFLWDFKHQSMWFMALLYSQYLTYLDGLTATQNEVATMPFVKHAQPATQIAGRLKRFALGPLRG